MCFQSKDFDFDWRYFVVKAEKMDSSNTSSCVGRERPRVVTTLSIT